MSQIQTIQPQAAKVVAKPSTQLRNMLEMPPVEKLFHQALGEHKDQFVASLIDLYSQDKQLQGCAPEKVIAEALRAATLRLPIIKSLGYSYIVVYKNNVKTTNPDTGEVVWTKVPTPTFILGYKGLIQLALRSGQYRNINSDVIFEGEMTRVDKLTGEIFIDARNRKSDKIVGYFAHFELLNGFSKTLFMSLEDMAKYAKRYAKAVPGDVTWENLYEKGLKNETGNKVGWMDNFTDMAQKTVLRRLLSKWGYLSVEMQTAFAKEQEEEERYNERESILEVARGETQTISLDNTMYLEIQPTAPTTPAPSDSTEDDDDEDTGLSTPQF